MLDIHTLLPIVDVQIPMVIEVESTRSTALETCLLAPSRLTIGKKGGRGRLGANGLC
jgi:hypothetical protein